MISPVKAHFLLYTLTLGAAVSLAVSLTVWAVPPAPQDFQLNGDPGRGQAVFAKNCALCHGAGGKGDGSMAPSLSPRPKDLTDRAVLAKLSDWEVYLVIRDGGKVLGLSPQMFGFKSGLKDQEIRDVAAYVRSLAK
jgi:mono/diheme cytochrome c family protein